MSEPWPEEATWTERLLLVASGEEPRTPEIDEALKRDPRVAALWQDLQVLEAAVAPEADAAEAPRLAIARAREAFEAEARPGWLARLRTAMLVPALAGVVALAVGLGEAPASRPGWDGAHIDADLAQVAEDLGAWEQELTGSPEYEYEPRYEYGHEPEYEPWDTARAWDRPSPWDALEDDLTRIEQALERL